MRIVKIVLSVIATFLLAAAGAAMAGAVHISQEGISFLQALAGALLVFGFTPLMVTQQLGKALAAVSLVISLAIGGQWAFLSHLELIHPGVVTALHVLGFINGVVAFFAHSQQVSLPPAPPPAPPAIPPAA